MSLSLLLMAALLSTAPAPPPLDANAVSVTVAPERPFIEVGADGTQHLNFDLRFESRAQVSLELVKLELDVRDGAGALVWGRRLQGDGFSPPLAVIPARELPAGKALFVFNPFHTFARGLPLSTLRFRATFEDDQERRVVASLDVHPRPFAQRTRLVLPLGGRLFVHSGHDFLAHHRRLDLGHPVLGMLGVRTNAGRYALDLCPADASGKLFRGEGETNEEWVGWGAPVRAPGAGMVVVAIDGRPDNRLGGPPYEPDLEVLKAHPMDNAGNAVVIDHGHGEFSLLAHLQQGSLTVKVGDRVRGGQTIARLGMSGDAYIPHVHYELRDAPWAGFGAEPVEGLPAGFREFRRVQGSRSQRVTFGSVDSGELVESIR